ncbi:hypothetical protein JL722_14091 [Aureococcus anophagefferens]|nr:hypothetical protein JL722_14091 [Aureococcus anophagefferens]
MPLATTPRRAVPDVVVPGDFSAERRGDVVELVAEAVASACPGEAPDSARLVYAWASTAGGEQLSEPNKFRLPAHATAAAFVDVEVTVTDRLGRENAASARVTYAPSPLEAAIAGADRRCGAASTATFAFTPAAAGDHVVTLAVSGGGRVAEATAELDAAVVVDPRGVPDVGVVTAFERATASGLCKFQADVGGDYVDEGISYVWRVVEGALEGSLASVAASPASGDVFAYRLVSLDVPCDALTAAGGPYGMELSAKYADGDEEARAVVRYAPASPPKAGELRVDPPRGVEATDLFQLSLPDAASFVPDRPKLEYAFFESDEACESEACEFAIVEVVAELIDAFEAVVELQADTVDEQETINTRAMIADAVTADVEALEAQAPEEQDALAATVADVTFKSVNFYRRVGPDAKVTTGSDDADVSVVRYARDPHRWPRRRLARVRRRRALDRRFEKREAAREAAASRAAATKARRPSSARQRTRLHQLEKSLAKQKLKAQLTPASSARDLKAHARSVHRAVLRASLPSVVTKHRLVRRTLRNPDEAEAKSFKELRLVLWTVYYNHSWFSIASVYSRDHPRRRRCLAFFETMIIAVADDAASCENIRSSTSFGTDNNCRWDVSTEPECVFDPPRGSVEIFFMRLQMAVVSVAITLPLLKFANWIFDSYVFAPVVTASELAARRRRGSNAGGYPSEFLAGRQLLANLGMDETMRLVLRQRQEIRDAIADLDDGVYDGAVAPPPRRGAAPPPAAAGPDIHDGDAAHAKRLLALYQLKVAEELHGIERDLFYRHCSLEAVKDAGAAGADAVSPNARRAAVGVVCLALVGMGYFMLFFARAYDRGSMQENWLYATVMTMFLIIFVFENLRSLILLIYLPALLVPKLRHIRDPLHVPLVPFRHETPVTPVQLVDVREARAVLKASAVPRRLHARLGTVRRESGLFVSTDDPTDVPRPVFWRAAADRWARFRDRLFDDDDELIVDADHDDRDVNRDFRRGHAAGWSLDNVRERLGYVNWERPRLHAPRSSAAASSCGSTRSRRGRRRSDDDDDGAADAYFRRADREDEDLFSDDSDVDLVPRRDDYDSDDDDLAEQLSALETSAFQQNIHVRFDRESSLASRPGDGDDDAGDGAAPDDDDDDDARRGRRARRRPRAAASWTRSRPTRRSASAARRTRGASTPRPRARGERAPLRGPKENVSRVT